MPQWENTPPLPTPPPLNHLLADSDHVQHIGDTTVVCWAEGADDAYQSFFSADAWRQAPTDGLSDNDLRADACKRLANGLPCDEPRRSTPNRRFLHSRSSRPTRRAVVRPLLSARQLRRA
ncbi:MAG: type I-C CRISPR-associated protein Cas8c/Csd1 [Oscillibacter sp.]